jgi:hypothetical protein
MPQPVSYNPGTPVSGSIQENNISYVVDGQQRNYRGGFGGLSWMSEVPAENNVIFIGNSTSLGRGPANIPLFYPSYNNSSANIVYAVNTLPGSPRNFTTTGSAYNWAVTNNFFINNSDNPIPRIDADSLSLYIDANQPTSYPQTGTSWYDLSGVGNNSTLYNGPTWNSKGYIDFDGTDDFVGIGNTGVTKLNQNYQTLRFLTYITSVGPNGYAELYAVFNANRTGIKWETAGIGMDANGDFYNVFVNVSNAYSRWMDITCVIDRVSNIFKVYKNGTYIGQDTFTGYTANSTSITVGANNLTGNGGDYIKGSISEISVYGKELSLAEVKQNYFQSNIVIDGLVFMIDANNLVSYPKSGTTSYSLTGSNTATLVNGVGYSSQNGGSFVFDGVDDYIQTDLNQNTDNALITWECWYFDDSPGGYVSNTALISNYGPSGTTPYTLLHVTTDGNVLFGQRNSVGAEASAVYSGNICDGRWHHVVGTVDSTNISMYIDGVYQSSNAKITGVTTSGQNIVIGSNHLDRYQSCRIANARLYNVALTPAQIQQNYQATKDKFQGQQIVTNGLVAYVDATNKDSYPGTGTTWYDLSGNGNNFTFSSTPNVIDGLFNSGASVFAYRNAIPVDSSINGYTLEACFKLNSSTGGGYQNITQNGGGDPTRHMMWYNGGSNSLLALFHTPNFYNNISDTLSLNTWYYVQLSYNPSGGGSNGRRAWINGVEKTVNNTAAGNGTPSSYFTISVDSDLASNKSDASYAFVRYYNRALSATEITQNYNATKGRFGL